MKSDMTTGLDLTRSASTEGVEPSSIAHPPTIVAIDKTNKISVISDVFILSSVLSCSEPLTAHVHRG